jgi:hypothetical protein
MPKKLNKKQLIKEKKTKLKHLWKYHQKMESYYDGQLRKIENSIETINRIVDNWPELKKNVRTNSDTIKNIQ